MDIAAKEGNHTRAMVQAAGDGGELVVVELEFSGVTCAGSRTVRAGLVVAEAEGAAQSMGLGTDL